MPRQRCGRATLLTVPFLGFPEVFSRARAAVQRHVAENLDPLLAELERAGRAASQRLDVAAEQLVAAFNDRMAIERQVFELISMVRPAWSSDVARSTADAIVAAVTAMQRKGGEQPPLVLHDPRQPRYAAEVGTTVPAA